MISGDEIYTGQESESAAVPYEAVPELAANEDFINLMERARQNKANLERIETDQENIRTEAGAMVAVAGYKSVAYNELVLTVVDGGTTKGKVTGGGLLLQASTEDPSLRTLEALLDDPSREAIKVLYAIALAAKDCDPELLIRSGCPAHLIEQAREPGKPRKGSVQLSWAGGKGRGGKRRAAGSGGTVQ